MVSRPKAGVFRAATCRTPLKAKQSILVVDAEKNIRGMVSTLLSRHGYAVDCAENAEEAMEHLKKRPVDLVILDVVLPDGDGVHLAELIKETNPNLPILLSPGLALMIS